MPFKGFLKKDETKKKNNGITEPEAISQTDSEEHHDEDTAPPFEGRYRLPIPLILRSDTHEEEVIPTDDIAPAALNAKDVPQDTVPKRRPTLRFRSNSKKTEDGAEDNKRRRSLFRSHTRDSTCLPILPDITVSAKDVEDTQAQWETRATILASGNAIGPLSASTLHSYEHQVDGPEAKTHQLSVQGSQGVTDTTSIDRPAIARKISSEQSDDDIQKAISLHEAGDLINSSKMFGRMADEGNALSQVLYGLALLHGWGIEPTNPQLGVQYLSKAAENAAQVEKLALASGMKRGGAAKGELVLAIYELANCFRNGLGVPKDLPVACVYFECCANLGDIEGANEAAYCYEHGLGVKKSKLSAAKYYRMAEQNGGKAIVGNSWIWKAKYNAIGSD